MTRLLLVLLPLHPLEGPTLPRPPRTLCCFVSIKVYFFLFILSRDQCILSPPLRTPADHNNEMREGPDQQTCPPGTGRTEGSTLWFPWVLQSCCLRFPGPCVPAKEPLEARWPLGHFKPMSHLLLAKMSTSVLQPFASYIDFTC